MLTVIWKYFVLVNNYLRTLKANKHTLNMFASVRIRFAYL